MVNTRSRQVGLDRFDNPGNSEQFKFAGSRCDKLIGFGLFGFNRARLFVRLRSIIESFRRFRLNSDRLSLFNLPAPNPENNLMKEEYCEKPLGMTMANHAFR